jgi:hypothetical protein
MMHAIRGQPNRGLRDLSSTMAWMSASLGPFGPGFLGHELDENSRRYLPRTVPDETPEASRDVRRWRPSGCVLRRGKATPIRRSPVAQRQVRRSLASTAQDDELLLEQEILRDHRAHATGTTELRGGDRQMKHGEQEVLHARVSVGQTSGATQRCPIGDSARELAIRDPQAAQKLNMAAGR